MRIGIIAKDIAPCLMVGTKKNGNTVTLAGFMISQQFYSGERKYSIGCNGDVYTSTNTEKWDGTHYRTRTVFASCELIELENNTVMPDQMDEIK